MKRTVFRRTGKRIAITGVMWAAGLLMIFPLLWMVSTSFKIDAEVFKFPIEWIPKNGTLKNFQQVWLGKYNFFRYYGNSILVTSVTVLLSVLVNTTAGYAFGRIRFKGKDALFLVYLSAMMIPQQVTLIPRYMIFHYVGILDSHLSLILPGMFRVICVFLMRQFFMQIPYDYTEAARIDGARELNIFTRVILPMAKPALITTIILVFTWSWNDYEDPLIFLISEKKFTLPLGLNHFKDELGIQYGPLMAASLSSILPIIVVFLCGQRAFIEGLTSGGVKG